MQDWRPRAVFCAMSSASIGYSKAGTNPILNRNTETPIVVWHSVTEMGMRYHGCSEVAGPRVARSFAFSTQAVRSMPNLMGYAAATIYGHGYLDKISLSDGYCNAKVT